MHKQVKIILIGELDLDLTKRGLKVGEIHFASIDKNHIAEFQDKRIDDKYSAMVYPDNYISLKSHEDFNEAISMFSNKKILLENQLQNIKDKKLRQELSSKRTDLRTIIEKLQVEHIKFE